ncbi:MAG TPA: plastocyanin/azurin family copper-binding protein [Candidatus Limnocylindrales bacterium]|nr:plastocyanin/azurin family copper-binding protein [Candidatus Limnocylindrales bacterium]
MRLRGVAGALATAALVAACASTGPSGSPVATSKVDLPPSYKFAPAAITVMAGTEVTWTNDDHFTHSVQFLDGGLPNAPLMMDPGATATFTFSAPGLYHYQCSLHPKDMQGTVQVTS